MHQVRSDSAPGGFSSRRSGSRSLKKAESRKSCRELEPRRWVNLRRELAAVPAMAPSGPTRGTSPNGDRRLAERPAARFARIDEQPAVLVPNQAGAVRVRGNDDVGPVDQAAELFELVRNENSDSVGGLKSKRRLSQRADDSHASENSNLVPVIVPKASQHLATQLPQRRHDHRRNQVAGKNNEIAIRQIELRTARRTLSMWS